MKYGWQCRTPGGSYIELVNVPDSDPPLVELTVMEGIREDDEPPEPGFAVAFIPEDKLQALARHILGVQPYQQDV